MSAFAHLHVHSQYSMLDSALRLKALVKTAKEFGMPAVALTDHGNMFGAVQLVSECKKHDIKPILGCEVNLCADRKSGRDAQHLVLLCSSQEGYRNLIQLTSLGWVEGYAVGKPRIDMETLLAHRKGLVGLSACMGGYLAQEVLQKGEDAGRAAIAKLRDCFEPGAFFVELQDHGFVEQKPLTDILVGLAREFSLPMVATNDCHYLERKNAHAQMVLQCIAGGTMVAEMERVHHRSEELYFKNGAEMAELFRHLPEAVENTLLVAEMCGGQANPFAKPMLPRFQVPEGSDEVTHFHVLAKQGLEERFAEFRAVGRPVNEPAYRERLEMEAQVIAAMGFAGYFLIVQDFINWAKQHGIPVGPGRGSGAGSLVAYSMRITDIDPIPYGLLFERFLNPERVSMPDFDIDFCMDRRDEVIDYVRQKYGKTSVGQIATFHLLKSKSVVRDVGRVMGMTPVDAGRIASFVPEPVQGKSVPIAEALKQEKRLKDAYDQDGSVKQLIDTAMDLEELNRHAGMHAAGVVISEGPLWDHVPVFCPEPEVYVTQYDKNDVESAGLVKFDFLGLKTLTTINIATKLINKRPDRKDNPFILERIAMDDATTYALLASGETTNVFQLESTGMQTLIKQLRPDNFDDIVALVALYRPGPLGSGMVDDYVAGKHGKKKVEYPHACLAESLKETHGVMVYQEQVMQAARVMAGYSLGGADLLRRAMGKKKAEEMAKQKATFMEGAQKNGHTAEDAERVFELMNYFSGYGFNKSHSAAYALISYQCAYLKAHFPVEFLCATMTADRDKIEKVVRTVAEARAMGITVLAPDVNESEIDFAVVYDLAAEPPKRKPNQPVALGGKLRDPLNPKIRFGLGAVKGVGSAALESILEARSTPVEGAQKPEPFADLFDFTSRVDLRRVNKGVIEALVQCGAMDSGHEPKGIGRDRALAAIDSAIDIGKKASADRESGQTDLFSALLGGPSTKASNGKSPINLGRKFTFPEVAEPWNRNEVLKREKSTLGFYVSGHPLDAYKDELKRFCNASTATIGNVSEGSTVTLGGMVEDYRERNTKSGGKMAFFFLDDPYGRIEVIVRQRAVEQFREILSGDVPLLISGVVRADREGGGGGGDEPGEASVEVKLLLDEAQPLVAALHKR
ncbi:MAG TPA: DNA polymerase III subunit alpha, partial [Polyangiales bacterium]|nr:DNA polymerase III subunit alpha [Polyangiales bacterium]